MPGRFYSIFFTLLPVCAYALQPAPTVKEVLSGQAFVTTAGDTVRLSAIETPVCETAPRGGQVKNCEPLANEAQHALATLIEGKPVRIDALAAPRDRHDWLIAQIYTAQGTWVQGALLSGGWGMVTRFDGDPHMIEKMLTLEAQARAAHKGIWNTDYYRVIAPQEASRFLNRFKLVEGMVTSVNLYHGNVYINFSRRWKGQFAVYISHKYLPAFSEAALLALPDKTIRVRGWIDYHHAPVMDITYPQQIEILAER